MIDSIAVSLFVDRLSLSNQKQEATGDEAGGAGESSRLAVTFPGRGYGHDSTVPHIPSNHTPCLPTSYLPCFTPGMTGRAEGR